MGDANPIRTLGDYSKPSHEGYKNTIELPVGNNVVPLRSDTIRLVQNGCSFHGLRSEDPNQHLKDFLKLVDSLDLDGENKERKRLLQIFYDRINDALRKTTNYAVEGLLRKFIVEEAWATIEKLAQYEDEGWNDLVDPNEGRLDHENPDIKQSLGIMERKVDTLMKDAISLMRRGESVFRMTTNELNLLPLEPSRQEEFKHIVMNFILDQEERVMQLEEYMKLIIDDFMQLSSEVTRRLKDKTREEGSRMRKIVKITKYPDMEVLEPLAGHKFPKTPARKTFPDALKSIPTNSLWIRYVQLNFSNPHCFQKSAFSFKPGQNPSPTMVMVHPFHLHSSFISIRLQYSLDYDFTQLAFATNQLVKINGMILIMKCGVLGLIKGEAKEYLSLELGWRVGLYSERQSRDNVTLSGLRKGVTVKENHLLLGFWPTIRDDGFNVGNTKVAAIKDPRIKLAHRCIATTIAGRKESTHRVTEIDLFYLYCIYSEEVVCNIPYCLAKYMIGMREKSLIYGGMFVTRIARSFRLLTNKMTGALSVKPPPYVLKKKSLISVGVVIELHNGECFWPAAREVMDEDDEGDCQVFQARWMDQQDEQWRRLNTWMGQQDEQAH
ncbi:hypothetical protein Tco_0976446 [Tanacetum coccineum]|uniref:MAK10-like protein n=1 Tax=Tanacetum coccineum TaxID=301880 RepID=A0ABQ5EH86_9ASTR